MDVYRKTLQMLDGSNLSGLAQTFSAEIVPSIWDEVRANGGGTEEVNQHPVAVLWMMKMVGLAAGECLCSRCIEAFGRAYATVKARAKERPEVSEGEEVGG